MNEELVRNIQRQIGNLTDALSKLTGEQTAPLFADYARGYLGKKLLRPTLRQSTKNAFGDQVRIHLIPQFGQRPIDKVTNTEWLEWIAKERTKTEGRRVTRFFNARKALVEILRASEADGHIERLPKLDDPDAPRNVGRALDDFEVYKILRHTRRPYFRLFFYTLARMGCRPREILQWEWSMITWGEPGKTWIEVPARITKTNRTRRIPINPDVSARLYDLWRDEPASRFVFPHRHDPNRYQTSYHGAWRTACRHGRVAKCVPYDLRRTFITKRAAKNKAPIYVAKVLDTSVKMMETVYTKAQADVMEDIVK